MRIGVRDGVLLLLNAEYFFLVQQRSNLLLCSAQEMCNDFCTDLAYQSDVIHVTKGEIVVLLDDYLDGAACSQGEAISLLDANFLAMIQKPEPTDPSSKTFHSAQLCNKKTKQEHQDQEPSMSAIMAQCAQCKCTFATSMPPLAEGYLTFRA